jgi:hypothetical protein
MVTAYVLFTVARAIEYFVNVNSKLRRRLMKKKTASLTTVAFVLLAFVGGLVGVTSAPALASSTTTTTPGLTSPSAGGLITRGSSRRECLAPIATGSGVTALETALTKFDTLTDTTVSCISTYLNGAQTWSAWEHPWVTQGEFGYTSWVAQAPHSRELVLQVDLIPSSLQVKNDPLSWETSCADGEFNSHAAQLGASLVAAGLQNSVIRLGAEMNGNWETDYAGTTPVEQRLWVRCFDSEVTGLRSAAGQHFLIDWNPNACIPFSKVYPGNSYVDIMGLDLFDVSCVAPKTKYSFTRLAHEPAGLSSFEAFAKAHHKPMSFPEWGLSKVPSGDDPTYIDGMGSVFDNQDFAFESYFDGVGKRIKTLALGSATPLSLPAFQRWFGNAAKP